MSLSFVVLLASLLIPNVRQQPHEGRSNRLFNRERPCLDYPLMGERYLCQLKADQRLIEHLHEIRDCEVDLAVQDWFLRTGGVYPMSRTFCVPTIPNVNPFKENRQ